MNIMDYSAEKLFSKKNIITFLLLAIIAAAVPVGLKLVQTQQILKSRAVAPGNEVTFPQLTKQDSEGNPLTNTQQIQIRLESPFGPPASTQQI